MMSSKQNYDEPSRPRLDPVLKEKIDVLANKLKLNIPLSSINNILCGIGLECLERSVDSVVEEIKSNKNFKKYFPQNP